MSRRLRGAALGLAVAGILAGAAIAHAASSTTTSKSAPASPRPHSGYQMPAAQHHGSGNCPNMGGSSGSGNSSDSSAPTAIGV
ncbi:MAG TPA: hypothetical protein VH834_05255 [Solirubrobacteraceae bacterium]